MTVTRFGGIRGQLQARIRDLIRQGATDQETERALRDEYGKLYRKQALRDDFRKARDYEARSGLLHDLGPDDRIPSDLRIVGAARGPLRYEYVTKITGRNIITGESGTFYRSVISSRQLTKRDVFASARQTALRPGKSGSDRLAIDDMTLDAVLEQ